MFAPFTLDEVESVRSIVLMGQQQDDMLLSNCSTRPLAQMRSFIRRFKRLLLDSQVTVNDIAKSANEQYVAIIAGVRTKRGSHKIANATSVGNFVSPLMRSIQTVPLKFRSKYTRVEAEAEQPQGARPPLTTRSRSLSEGLAMPDISVTKRTEEKIPVMPPLSVKILRACRSIDELRPGMLAAVIRAQDGNAIPVIGRILGTKIIDGEGMALVAFFQPDMKPCYVRPEQIVKEKTAEEKVLTEPFTVDSILESITEDSSSLVIDVSLPGAEDIGVHEQQRKCVVFKSFRCAMQLSLLSFAANYKVPEDKLRLMLNLVQTLNPVKYMSSVPIDAKCQELIEMILAKLD